MINQKSTKLIYIGNTDIRIKEFNKKLSESEISTKLFENSKQDLFTMFILLSDHKTIMLMCDKELTTDNTKIKPVNDPVILNNQKKNPMISN